MTTVSISTAPRVYLETYGCQMNIADSQTVTAVLRSAGYATADKPDDADIILINTCAIREHAEDRVIGRLSDLARLKQGRPDLKLGLLGCMAQHNRAGLLAKASWVDVVAGPDSYRRLPDLLGSSRAGANEPHDGADRSRDAVAVRTRLENAFDPV